MDIVKMTESGMEAARKIVRGAKPDKLSSASPCEGWDGRAALNHLVGGMKMFATAAQGGAMPSGQDGEGEPDFIGDDPAKAFDDAAAALTSALHEPGALERTWALPIGEVPGSIGVNIAFMEVCVHGWDVARATGQQIDLDGETGEALWGITQQLVQPQFRQPGIFGPEVTAPEDAPPIDRAAAYTGRKI